MRRSARFVTVLSALVIVLAGCSSETPGDAMPGDTGNGTNAPFPTEGSESGEPPDTGTSGPDGGDPSVESLAPCDLLTDSEHSSLSLGPGEEETVAGARSCTWQASGSHTVGLDIWDNLGIDELQSKTDPQPTTVGSHDQRARSKPKAQPRARSAKSTRLLL